MCRWIGSPGGSPSTNSRRSAEAGFTLIEVLVAFAVLAIVLVPLLQVFGGGLGTTQTARTYARATLLARSKLAEIGVDQPLREGEETGSFDDRDFRWRTEVVRDDSEVIAPQLATDSRRRRRSRDGGDAGSATGAERSRSGFGQGSSGGSGFGQGSSGSSFGRGGSSGFGQSRSGFGSAFGQSGSSFGGSGGSGFGQGGSGGSGLSGQEGTRATGAGAADDDELPDEPTLLAYRVIVTVEWGPPGRNSSLTLSSLRVARPDTGEAEAGESGAGADSRLGRQSRSGSGNRTGSRFERERGSGFGSGSGSGSGSRLGGGSR